MIRCVFAAFMVAAAAYGASAADPTCHFVGQTGYVCMNEGEACYDRYCNHSHAHSHCSLFPETLVLLHQLCLYSG